MISQIQLTHRSQELLRRREISHTQAEQFEQLLNQANASLSNKKQSAKQILANMTKDELALLQHANALADPIRVHELSEEGATNLLKQPDHSDRVDLNNDGIVEVGKARSMVFPPVNAPQYVKDAWSSATEGMSEGDKMTMQMHMHLLVYGIQIDGHHAKSPLPAEQQWNGSNTQTLIEKYKDALEFSVGMDGWTKTNRMKQDFIERFESAINRHPKYIKPIAFEQHTTQTTATNNTASSQPADSKSDERPPMTAEERQKMFNDMFQSIIDSRLQLDRKALEEIEAKMKAIEADETLTDDQKKELLDALEQEKQDIIERSQERLVEETKRKQQLM